uniref:Uncharacterized protein n=1 Tax=Physcomitrium patens TaxID=3218 RepID=A0A7I4BY02_PHYPA
MSRVVWVEPSSPFKRLVMRQPLFVLGLRLSFVTGCEDDFVVSDTQQNLFDSQSTRQFLYSDASNEMVNGVVAEGSQFSVKGVKIVVMCETLDAVLEIE